MEQICRRDRMVSPRLPWCFGGCGRALSGAGMSAKVFRRNTDVSHGTVTRQSCRGIEWRISDLKQPCSRLDRMAGYIRVIKKNRRAEDHNCVVARQLIGERFLGRQQTTT